MRRMTDTVGLVVAVAVRVMIAVADEVAEGELDVLTLGHALPVEETEAVDDTVAVQVSTSVEPKVFVGLAVADPVCVG